jgi:prepilin-type N-terminal cleavage/methylation domain-containing protein
MASFSRRSVPRRAPRFGRPGFTLIELLVVIAIIALLVSILMPSLAQAKRLARTSVCLANLHHVGPAVGMYINANNMNRPWLFTDGSADYPHEFIGSTFPGNPVNALVPTHITDAKLFFCPVGPVRYADLYVGNVVIGPYWGTYTWHYVNISGAQDPDRALHSNTIQYATDQARDVLMTDSDEIYWANRGYIVNAGHFNAIMADFSACMIAKSTPAGRQWLWGPIGKPYDGYAD